MKIHRIRGFLSYSYIIETPEGLYLADAGFIGQGRTLLRFIERIGRSPDEIRFCFITHGHIDHYGGLPELQDAADFPVLAHEHHAEQVSAGAGADVSPGIVTWAKGYEQLANVSMRRMDLRPIRNVVPVEGGTSLDRWGLAGRVLDTPGHTGADVSMLLDSGDAFVGDIVQGRRMPFLPPELPAMACDVPQVLRSWDLLLGEGAREIWPAHGSRVSGFALRFEGDRLRRKHVRSNG